MEARAGAEPFRVPVPEAFLCPISGEIMWDPVMVFESQQTYDRSSIEKWFEGGHLTDPMTNEVLQNPDARAPVRALRDAIREHLRALPPFCDLPNSEEDWRAADVVFESVEGPLPVTRQQRLGGGAGASGAASSGGAAPSQPRGPPDAPPAAPLSRCVQTLTARSGVMSLAVAPDGNLFSGHRDGRVQQWRDGACVGTLEGHRDVVGILAVAPDGSLFSGSRDKTVRQWRGGRCVAELKGHKDGVTSLAAAADGSVYSGSVDMTIRQWRGGVCVAELRGHQGYLSALAVAADGALFSGSFDGTIWMWRGGKCAATLRVPAGQCVAALALAPDGSLFSGGGSMWGMFWRTLRNRFWGGQQGQRSGGSKDYAIRQWREGHCVATLEGHTNGVVALAVAPDGSLFSGSFDKSVRQWRDGRCVAVLEGHTDSVRALALAPDGSLFSGSRDCTIRQWR